MAQRQGKKARSNPAYPFPEAITGRSDSWSIYDDPADGGTVDIAARRMVVTLDATRVAANVRAHELGHIKWSPEKPTPCGDSDIDVIRAMEDGRINLNLSRNGVDLSAGLHDTRKFNQGFASSVVLGQLREAVLAACAVFGTGHEADIHKTLYRLKREKLAGIVAAATMIEECVIKMREAFNLSDIRSYAGTQRMCEAFDAMMNTPPEPEPEESDGEGEAGEGCDTDKDDSTGGEGDGDGGTDGDGEKDDDKPATEGDSKSGGGKDDAGDQEHKPADDKDSDADSDDEKSDGDGEGSSDGDDEKSDGDSDTDGDSSDDGESGDSDGSASGGEGDGKDSDGDAEESGASDGSSSRDGGAPQPGAADRMREALDEVRREETTEEVEARAKRELRARRALERARQAREAASRAAAIAAKQARVDHVVEARAMASDEFDERRIVYGSPRILDELCEDGIKGIDALMDRRSVSNLKGEWSPMHKVKCHLPKRITRTEAPRKRWAQEGYNFRAPHRLFSDGNAFMQSSGGRGGGSVLIDCSGSMGLTLSEVKALVKNAPAVQVAMYWGVSARANTRMSEARLDRMASPESRAKVGVPADMSKGAGYLRVIANHGRVAEDTDVFTTGYNNCCDGTALREWLAKQPHPRIWVSDGMVTGVDDGMRMNLLADVRRLCITKGIIRVGRVANALELFEKIRKRQARTTVVR